MSSEGTPRPARQRKPGFTHPLAGEQASAVVESVGTTGSLNHEQLETEVSHKEEALHHQNAEGVEVEQDADDPPVLRTEVKVAEQASNCTHGLHLYPPLSAERHLTLVHTSAAHSVPDVAPRLGMACHCF